MRELGHVAGGYLTTRALLQRWRPAPRERNALLALGLLASTLPDTDVLGYALHRLLRGRSLDFSEFDHHQWISHTFPPYVALGLLGYGIARGAGSQRWPRRVLVIALMCGLHLLQDSIGSGTGLMWAWPLSRRMDGLVVLGVKGDAWRDVYANHPISWVERGLVALAGIAALWDGWRWWRRRSQR